MAKTFPVLWQGTRDHKRRLEALGCPREVPWEFIAERGVQCACYHDQTPEELARRGGLSPEEMVVIREDRRLTTHEKVSLWHMTPEESVPRLIAALAWWKSWV